MQRTTIIKQNMKTILGSLSKINLPSDFKIQAHREFTFNFDGFKDSAKLNEAIITLNHKNEPQEVIKFGVADKRIDVQYIQRVGTSLIKTKENRNILLEALIFSSIPLLKKGCSFTCEKIPFLKEMYATIINHPEKKYAYSKDHLRKELDLYNPIRDRYFTKEGVLNFKKERVTSILNNCNLARKTKSIKFPKTSLVKKVKPRKLKVL